MHFVTVVSTLLLVGASASPHLLESRQDPQHVEQAVPDVTAQKNNVGPFYVSAMVQKAIDDLMKTWPDPHQSKSEPIDISLPDGSVHINGMAKEITVAGFSALEVKTMRWRPFLPGMAFHIHVPELDVSAELFEGDLFIFHQPYKVEASGWVAIKDVNIVGTARLSLGNPIAVRDVDAELSFSSMESQVVVHLAGVDYSSPANDFINHSLHAITVANNDVFNNFLRSLLQGVL